MPELLEFLLDLLCNAVDLLERWRFSLCILIGGALAYTIHARVHNPKVSAALVVTTLLFAVISGVTWEVRSS